MSIYELLAEEKRYFRFHERPMVATGPHFHRAVELLFIYEGTQAVVVGGEQRILQPGEGCFCDSFCVHAYEKNANAPSTYVVGDRAYFQHFFSERGNKTPPKFFRFDNFTLLRTLREICNKNYQNEAGRYASIEGAMSILLAEIAEKNEFVLPQASRQNTLVCDVLQYAEAHITKDLSLSALSDVFHLSREHLSRVLHRYLTENWNVYVGRLRARHAHELLQENPSLCVLDAAFACGFDSANTFYRAYKKEFGFRPRTAIPSV